MPRITAVAPPYEPAIQAAFDALTPPGREPLLLFRTLAANPRVYERFRAGALLDRGLLTLRQRELVIDRTCALNRCEYEWGVHITIFAQKARLSEAQMRATVDGGEADWSADEALLLRLCESLHRVAPLPEALWSRLRAHFSEAQLLEAIALVGFYRTVALYANCLELPLEPGAARFPVID
jgi:alkylhydroperoxidase family enzyme